MYNLCSHHATFMSLVISRELLWGGEDGKLIFLGGGIGRENGDYSEGK